MTAMNLRVLAAAVFVVKPFSVWLMPVVALVLSFFLDGDFPGMMHPSMVSSSH